MSERYAEGGTARPPKLKKKDIAVCCIAALLIPLITVFTAMSLGRPENYKLPGWTRLLYYFAAGQSAKTSRKQPKIITYADFAKKSGCTARLYVDFIE